MSAGDARERAWWRPRPGHSFADTDPDLVDDWHPRLNTRTPQSLRPGSSYLAWWRCALCGHEWRAQVALRHNGHGCPGCSGRGATKATSLAALYPALSQEWDTTLNDRSPSDVRPGSNYGAWWRCGLCEHTWQTRVNRRTRGSGCPACSGRVATPGRSFADLFPESAAEWHPSKNDRRPDDVRPASVYRAWWVCRGCGNEWCSAVYSRADPRGRGGCPRCARRPRVSLVESHPELVSLWDPRNTLRPDDVSASSRKRVRWRCPDCNHEWMRSIATVAEHSVCPGCAGVEAAPGRSLADLYPSLVADWSPLNEVSPTSITPRSVYRAIWRCSTCSHEWSRRVDMRVKGAACPNCKMAGRSRWECRIRHELTAVGVPVVYPHPKIPVVGRSPVMADIVVPG